MGLYDDEIYAEYAVENEKLKKQVETLRAALKPFAEASQIRERASFSASYLRAAAAAYRETSDE